MSENIKLKPCPFCGEEPKLEVISDGEDRDPRCAYTVVCESCDAQGACFMENYKMSTDDCRKGAIEYWNRRTP